jgi:hypothetical protein
MTIEHIVPFAMGGSDSFTITTCHASNSNLGSTVDAPFLDFFPVRSKRFFLGLESTSGNQPSIDLGGMGTIENKEVPISYFIQGDTKELKIAKPSIVKSKNADGTERWQVSGDPAQVRQIIEGKLRKQSNLGKTLTSDEGKVLELKDLDALFSGRELITENPAVVKTIHFDPTMPVRFFAKLALAVAHYHLGEAFSRSEAAERLRKHIDVTDYSFVSLSGAIFPYVDGIQGLLSVVGRPYYHTIAIVDGSPRFFIASLFGEFGALIQLDEPTEGAPSQTDGHGTVWRIELPSRKLHKMTMNDLYDEREAVLQRERNQ